MPFRRSYRKKPRRKFNRKRRFRRGGYKRMKRGGQSVYYFKRNGNTAYEWADLGATVQQITNGGAGTAGQTVYNLQFRLQDIPNYTEFTALYDEYRIKGIKCTFIPVANVSEFVGITGSTGSIALPNPTYGVRSFTALDFNSGVGGQAVSTIDGMREYQNVKWKPYNRVHSRFFYPRTRIIESGGTSLTLGSKPWVSTTTGQDAPWDGLVFGVDPVTTSTTSAVLYKIEIKYYLQFRTVR